MTGGGLASGTGRRWRWAAAALAVLAMPHAAEGQTPHKTAVFDLELVDTSQEGEKPEHGPRLILASEVLRRTLSETGRYVIVPVAPAAARITDAGYLHSCNGCEAAIARDLGAEIAVIGTVYKVSTLIMYIAVTVRDATTGDVVRAASVGIRGDTDESWTRGARYIALNRM